VSSICFLDGARFSDAHGLLRALHGAVLEMDQMERYGEVLHDLVQGRGSAGQRPVCFHIVWLNSEVSRRTLGGSVGGESAFDAATRWLATCRSIDLILL
jgi:hypothetical protein